jgi:hypothetical protein
MTTMTAFDPAKNGFSFANTFGNDFVPALDIHTDGLCGGMSYAALDYFNTKVPVTTVSIPPANGTVLYNYLYDRQVTSIENNLDHWAELIANPGGARNAEFFNWGLRERLAVLRRYIDAGVPVVLGLKGDGQTGDHQVIAIGYDMGQYAGDLGAHQEDLRILTCDPNYPHMTMRLYPDVNAKLFRYVGSTETWRTYYVDEKYASKQPPVVAGPDYPSDNLVHEIALGFSTGDDDLRGGNDNVDATLKLSNGQADSYPNLNGGARWFRHNSQWARLILHAPIPLSELESIVLKTTFGGGISGDNWDAQKVSVYAWVNGNYNPVAAGGPKRFTGTDPILEIPVSKAAGRAWTDWKPFSPAHYAARVALACHADGRMQIATLERDLTVSGAEQAGLDPAVPWSGWKTLAQPPQQGGGLAVAAHADSRLHALIWGQTHNLFHSEQQAAGAASSWTNWQPVGTQANSFALAPSPDGRMQIVATLMDTRVVWAEQQSAGLRAPWSAFSALSDASNKAKAVALAAHPDGRMHALMIGLDDQVWHNVQRTAGVGAAWTGWNYLSHPGNKAKAVALAAHPDGRMHALMIGLDDTVWHNEEKGLIFGWTDWSPLSHPYNKAKAVAIAAHPDGRMHAVMIGLDDAVWHNEQMSGGAGAPWTDWYSLSNPGDKAKAIALASHPDGRMHAVRIGMDDQVLHNQQVL